jgi:hypothetical protein
MKTDTPETDAATHDLSDYGPPVPCSWGDWVAADYARKLERERDEARAETIRTREFMDYGFAKAQEQLATVTEQRDRLAVALRKVSRSWNYAEVTQQALQSLTQNEP